MRTGRNARARLSQLTRARRLSWEGAGCLGLYVATVQGQLVESAAALLEGANDSVFAALNGVLRKRGGLGARYKSSVLIPLAKFER